MPDWPGPVMGIVGGVLAVSGLALGTLAATGQVSVANPDLFGWVAIVGALLLAAGLIYGAVRQIRVRRVLPPERYRGPAVILLLALALVAATAIQVPFAGDVGALIFGEGEMSTLGAVVLLTSTQAALLVVAWLFVFRPNALAGLQGPLRPGAGAALRAGLLWGVVAWLGSTLLLAAVVLLLQAVGIDTEPQTAELAVANLDPWIVVPAVVILAPIAEEIFFRGVVFNAWLREGGRRWAFIGSSLLFAAIHLSLASLLPIFALGLALAWVYDRTRNLLAPMAMHAVVNGVSVAFVLLAPVDPTRLPV